MDPMAGEEDGVIQKRYVHCVSGVNKKVVEFCFGPQPSMMSSLALSKSRTV